MEPFIDPSEIWSILNGAKADRTRVRELIAKSLSKERLTLAETAVLINAEGEELTEEIKAGARELKKKVYGNRIVLFAPLYIGNKCSNNCQYCGFRVTNKEARRKTLSDDEIIAEVEALEDNGQKRLILVYGEHPEYNPEYIAHTVKLVYGVKKDRGEIRRVNINAAPLDIDGFRTVGRSGIGTYQIFQETYDPDAYKLYHLGGKKSDYNWRLTALDRAQEAGIDDVGIGALFGLYDWRFEVMGLVRHTNHLEACYNVGPHTISFPRIKDASMLNLNGKYYVSDDNFKKLIAILRLAVPYTGLILTARETPMYELRQWHSECHRLTAEQSWNWAATPPQETRNRTSTASSLRSMMSDHWQKSLTNSLTMIIYLHSVLPVTGWAEPVSTSWNSPCPGFIKRYCTPNAILTLSEYIVDYATPARPKRDGGP